MPNYEFKKGNEFLNLADTKLSPSLKEDIFQTEKCHNVISNAAPEKLRDLDLKTYFMEPDSLEVIEIQREKMENENIQREKTENVNIDSEKTNNIENRINIFVAPPIKSKSNP